MSLIKRWGLGVDLVFEGRDAIVEMTRTHKATARLRQEFGKVGDAASNFVGKLGQLGLVMAPIAAAFGLAVGKGSQLAADLEAQSLTMRILLGDAGKAAELIDLVRAKAAATPFAEGDLLEGSKRLLGLTKGNVTETTKLLDLAMTIAALNPGRSVVDAVEALLDAAGGGGFERIKELNVRGLSAEQFKDLGVAGGEAWQAGVLEAIQGKVGEVTRGADLVGELSKTFTGRVSTMKDAITNAFREFGQVVNAEVGPMLEPVTERLKALGPVVRQAAEGLAASVRRVVEVAQPWIDRILGWWDSLGTDGQARIFQVAMAIGALSAVLLPIGAAVGAVVFAVTSLIGAIAAAWPVISAVGGALVAALAPEILIPVAAALGLVALGAVALYAALSEPGEGPLDTLIRIGDTVRLVLVDAFERAKLAWAAFSAGFGETFAGISEPLDRIRQAFEPIVTKLAEFFALVNGRDGQDSLELWNMLGQALGMVGNFLITKVVAGMELVAAVLDVVVSAWRPMGLALDSFLQGLVGLVTGSMDAEDAILLMVNGIAGALVGLVNLVFQLLAGSVEIFLRGLVLQLAGLPGMDGLISATGNLGADAIAGARQAFEQETSNAIAGLDLAENRAAAAKADKSGPTVNVTPQVDNAVAVETKVCLDGREIARAQGAAQVRAGQRQGENIPAESRGRVLRGGVVRSLEPAEVW